MACTSGNVQSAADKTTAARQQLEKLQSMIVAQDDANKISFNSSIAEHLGSAGITDAREISYNKDIKTEYVSEFSLDKVTAVVTSTLTAIAKAADPTVPAGKVPLTPEAIAAYSDVVNKVAEAAKSTATSGASLSFAMNRLCPGFFAFVYASAVNLKDEDTFGTEAITTTAIYFKLIQSIDDVKKNAEYDASLIDAKNYLDMKTLQAGLTEMLSKHEISIEDWTKRDAAYSAAVDAIKKRLDAHKFATNRVLSLSWKDGFGAPFEHSFSNGSSSNQKLISDSLQKLSTMGPAYKIAIEKSEARLASTYY